MKCGQCGADIMLGSAACQRCGWSPLGAAPVPPTQDLGGSDPFVGGDSPAPNFAPPPPPPPGYTPPPPGQMAVQVTGAQPQSVPQGKSSGCGCLSFIVLLAIAGAAVGIFAAVRSADEGIDSLGDVFDSGDEGFDGEPLDGPAVAVGEPAVLQSLGDDEVRAHPLEGSANVVIRVFGVGDFDPEIRIESADGEVLAENDDFDGLDSRAAIDLAQEPGAVLLVREHTADPGQYSVVAFELAGPPADLIGEELAVGSEVVGMVIAPTEVVTHRFVGTGDRVSIVAEGVDGFDPRIIVLDAAGQELAANDDFSSETGLDARVDLTVPAGTEVVVQVSGFGSSTGPYRLSASD